MKDAEDDLDSDYNAVWSRNTDGQIEYKNKKDGIRYTKKPLQSDKLAAAALAAEKASLPAEWAPRPIPGRPGFYTYFGIGGLEIADKPINPQPTNLDDNWIELVATVGKSYYHPDDPKKYVKYTNPPLKQLRLDAEVGLDSDFIAVWSRSTNGTIVFEHKASKARQSNKPLQSVKEAAARLAAAGENLPDGWSARAEPSGNIIWDGPSGIVVQSMPSKPQPVGLDDGWIKLDNDTYIHPKDTADYIPYSAIPLRQTRIDADKGLAEGFKSVWSHTVNGLIEYEYTDGKRIQTKPLLALMDAAQADLDDDYIPVWSRSKQGTISYMRKDRTGIIIHTKPLQTDKIERNKVAADLAEITAINSRIQAKIVEISAAKTVAETSQKTAQPIVLAIDGILAIINTKHSSLQPEIQVNYLPAISDINTSIATQYNTGIIDVIQSITQDYTKALGFQQTAVASQTEVSKPKTTSVTSNVEKAKVSVIERSINAYATKNTQVAETTKTALREIGEIKKNAEALKVRIEEEVESKRLLDAALDAAAQFAAEQEAQRLRLAQERAFRAAKAERDSKIEAAKSNVRAIFSELSKLDIPKVYGEADKRISNSITVKGNALAPTVKALVEEARSAAKRINEADESLKEVIQIEVQPRLNTIERVVDILETAEKLSREVEAQKTLVMTTIYPGVISAMNEVDSKMGEAERELDRVKAEALRSINGSFDDEQWTLEYSVSQNKIRYVNKKIPTSKMFDKPSKVEANRRKGLISDIKLKVGNIPGYISAIEIVYNEILFVMPSKISPALRLSIEQAIEVITRARAEIVLSKKTIDESLPILDVLNLEAKTDQNKSDNISSIIQTIDGAITEILQIKRRVEQQKAQISQLLEQFQREQANEARLADEERARREALEAARREQSRRAASALKAEEAAAAEAAAAAAAAEAEQREAERVAEEAEEARKLAALEAQKRAAAAAAAELKRQDEELRAKEEAVEAARLLRQQQRDAADAAAGPAPPPRLGLTVSAATVNFKIEALRSQIADAEVKTALDQPRAFLHPEVLEAFPDDLLPPISPIIVPGQGHLLGGEISHDIKVLPNKWRQEHAEVYRVPELIKLLSLNPVNIDLPLFTKMGVKKDAVKKLIVLLVFWNIEQLFDLYNNKLTQRIQGIIKSDYDELIANIQTNNSIIIPFAGFSASAQFVLLDDLYKFYRKIIRLYVGDIDPNWAPLFAYMIQDYEHWKGIELQFLALKKNIVESTVDKNKIDTLYLNETSEPVITYLKVRCDTQPEYNEYFNIYVQNKLTNKSVYITGPDPNLKVPLYDPTNPIPDGLGLIKYVGNEPGVGLKKGTLKEIEKLGYGYEYGPFTDVFGPRTTNAEMAQRCTHIMDSLKSNRSVVAITYGISGSGKTTTAISADYIDARRGPVKEPGIILEICKNLIGVNEIFVTVHEIFSNKINKTTKQPEIEKIYYDNIKFVRSGQEFIIDRGNNFPPDPLRTYIQRVKRIENDKIVWKDVTCSWSIINGVFTHSEHLDTTGVKIQVTELGSFLVTLITKVRIVRPTPNNPESSRSHILAHLKMKIPQNTDNVFLTIIDAAGVENKFTCEDPETKKQFLNLKLPKEDKPYYVKEQYNDLVRSTLNTLDDKILKYFEYTKIEDVRLVTQAEYTAYFKRLDAKFKYIENSFTYLRNTTNLLTDLNIKYVNDLIDTQINLLIDRLPTPGDKSKMKEYVVINTVYSINKYAKARRFNNGNYNLLPDNQWIPAYYNVQSLDVFNKNVLTNGKLTMVDQNKTEVARNIDVYNYLNDLNYSQGQTGVLTPIREIYSTRNNNNKFWPYLNLNARTWADTINVQSDTHNRDLLRIAIQLENDLITEIETKKLTNPIYNQIQTLIEYKNSLDIDAAAPGTLRLFMIIKPLQQAGLIEASLSDQAAFTYSMKSEALSEIAPKYLRFLELYKQLKDNILLFFGEIYNRCDERRIEGVSINKTLNDMRTSLMNIIKVNQRVALFQSIPLSNSECLEYYCNPKLYNCFSLEKNKFRPAEEDIFEDIRQVYNNDDRVRKLLIVIIALTNITKTVHNPPPTPYIDLTLIKRVRDEYFTLVEYGEEGIGPSQLTTVPLFDKVNLFWVSYIKPIIDKFKESIGIPLHAEIEDRYTQFNTEGDNTKKYNQLIAFVDIAEKLNAITILGTFDFLHLVKNSLHTDISCNILALPPQTNNMFTQINSFKNIVTGEQYVDKFRNTPKELIYRGIGGAKKKLLKQYSKYKKMLKNI
jgi:hypothetical protein